ncbi:hypothetical protein BIS06_01020, partial [Halomonas sp. BBD48]|nr:hypothetical protein [Halomonas sp. BBD48]
MYRDIVNQRDVSLPAIRQALPQVSLPRKPSDAQMAALGYPRIQSTPRPTGDVVTLGESQERDSVWYQTWKVRELTEDELAEQLAQARQDALTQLNADYEAAMRPLIKTYPELERESWDQQKSEASAYQAWLDDGSQGTAPATPVLDRILAGRNGTDGTE